MRNLSAKILALGVLNVVLFGCQPKASETPNAGGSSATVNTNSGANTVSATNTSSTNANANANANVSVKPADNSPKRIVFSKGANWGATNITLAAGAAQKFVVGAKTGQMMDVEVSSKETSVNLIKGKAQTTEDFGYLNAELQGNGDYVFEVKNSTKKEIKTSVKVTIEGFEPTQKGVLNDVDQEKDGGSNGEGQGADDGDRPAPPKRQ